MKTDQACFSIAETFSQTIFTIFVQYSIFNINIKFYIHFLKKNFFSLHLRKQIEKKFEKNTLTKIFFLKRYIIYKFL